MCSITLPPIALHSSLGTLIICAAALSSMSRAVAPALRSGSHELRTLALPPVVMSPYFVSKSACFTVTRAQSASNSSAKIIASAVRTPCPISDLATVKKISPLGLISINAFGWKSPRAESLPLASVPRCVNPCRQMKSNNETRPRKSPSLQKFPSRTFRRKRFHRDPSSPPNNYDISIARSIHSIDPLIFAANSRVNFTFRPRQLQFVFAF